MQQVLRVLHLEDANDDAVLIRAALADAGIDADLRTVKTRDDFMAALTCGGFDLILADKDVAGYDGQSALETARKRYPGVPFIFVTALPYVQSQLSQQMDGPAEGVPKHQLKQLAPAIERALASARQLERHDWSHNAYTPTERLINVVQELSLARDLPSVMACVRRAARELTGADGATFILRDGDQCHYAEEDAIGPLWKGKRFPMSACISGWVMMNKQPAVIEDIYDDARIPAEAYRPTFVKSLAVVPIRTAAPVGAIGNYWATRHQASAEQVKLLQALADSTSIALENVQLYADLERRVAQRTEQLQAANKELEAFSYSVSHDLRTPLRSIEGFSRLLVNKSQGQLDAESLDFIQRILRATQRMGQLIEDLLSLSRLTQTTMTYEAVDLSRLAEEVGAQLHAQWPDRQVDFSVEPQLRVQGDARLLRVALENLLANAWKYTSKRAQAAVKFGCETSSQQNTYYVQDNGAGFDMTYAHNLFGPFQRLHTDADFPGTGVGLATVQRIVHRHGGRIWAEATPGQGATFYFTLEVDDALTAPDAKQHTSDTLK